MGLSISIDVSGLSDITSSLQDIASKVRDFTNGEAKQIADDMVEKMQAICPVDTGYLRDHITSEEIGDGSATVTSEADYSIYVEFGTRHMAAEPFFFPVVDEFTIQSFISDFMSQVF